MGFIVSFPDGKLIDNQENDRQEYLQMLRDFGINLPDSTYFKTIDEVLQAWYRDIQRKKAMQQQSQT
ncbi:MAG: hypothetical protein HQL68_11625, partial [Magnetococcales bacterium]|nr:hypothetical protein [Magnetococcales bacterium]